MPFADKLGYIWQICRPLTDAEFFHVFFVKTSISSLEFYDKSSWTIFYFYEPTFFFFLFLSGGFKVLWLINIYYF